MLGGRGIIKILSVIARDMPQHACVLSLRSLFRKREGRIF